MKDWAEPRWPKTWPTALVVNCATLGPVGAKLPAPGTWGSLVGVGYFAVALSSAPWAVNLGISILAAYLAVGLCGEAELRLRQKDPGSVVLDEFVAMPLCFLGWQHLLSAWPAWVVLLAGFAWFRFFDILKPLGIRTLQRLPGGLGVVTDDIAAALAACAALHLSAWGWSWVL